MKFRKKISKKELIKTLQNNYEVMLERKNELYNENIELQRKVKKLEAEKLTLNHELTIMGIQVDELKKERTILKGKYTKLKNKTNVKVEVTAPSIEKGNKIIEKHFEEKQKGEALSNGRF